MRWVILYDGPSNTEAMATIFVKKKDSYYDKTLDLKISERIMV